MKKIYFLTVLFLSLNFNSFGSQMFAGELTYEWVGQDSFMIYLTLYRDCNGVPLSSATIPVKSVSGASITTLTISKPSPTDITPICDGTCTMCQSSSCSFPYGIEQYIYQKLLVIDTTVSACEIVLSYSMCCRNTTINTGGASQNFYLEARMNRCVFPGNSSPKFTAPPFAIICIGQDFNFNHGIYNVPGQLADSIGYKWTLPRTGTTTNIAYTNPYAYNTPIYFWGFPNSGLPFPRGFHLDKITGDISFRPMKTEQTILCLEVEEFRNGVSIGKVYRDMQIIVMNCPNNRAPILSGPFYKEVCEGSTVSFSIQTNDYDQNDTLHISWNEAITGATWSDNNDSVNHPIGNLSWTPPSGSASSVPYIFTVTVKDDACPVAGKSTRAYQILVKNTPNYNISYVDSGCHNFWIQVYGTPNATTTFHWVGNFDPVVNSTQKIWHHQFANGGTYPFSLLVGTSGCYQSFFDTIVVNPFPHFVMPNDTHICYGESIDVDIEMFDTFGNEKFYWGHGDSGISKLTYGPLFSDTVIHFFLQDANNCLYQDSMLIQIHQYPQIINQNNNFCFNNSYILKPTFVFDKTAINAIQWKDLSNNSIIGNNIQLNFTNTTEFEIWVQDQVGCETKDTFKLYKNELELIIGTNITTCEYDTLKIIPVVKNNIGKTNYLWSNLSNSYNLNSIINHDQWLSLEISDSVGCKTHDSVWVDVKNVDLKMNQKYDFCAGDSISIAAIYTLDQTNTNVSIEWFESSFTNRISSGSNLITTNQGTYILKVTDTMNCWDTTSFKTIAIPLPIIEIYSQIPKTTLCPEYGQVQMFASISGGQWSGNVDNQGIFDANKAEGDYDIYYYFKDNNGCDNTDTFSFTIQKNYIDIISTDTQVCKNESIALEAEMGSSDNMLWFVTQSDGNFIGNNNNQNIVFQHGNQDTASRGFWIYAKTIDQVCPEATDSQFIYIAALPKADFNADVFSGNFPLTVNFSNASTIDYDNIIGYYWGFGDGNISILQNPQNIYNTAGNFDVLLKVVSDFGCLDSLVRTNYISVNSSVNDIENSGIKIYPNPASENIIIESEKEIEQIQIYNSLSQLVWEKEKPLNKEMVDVSQFAKGIYLVKIIGYKGEVAKYIIVQ